MSDLLVLLADVAEDEPEDISKNRLEFLSLLVVDCVNNSSY